MSVQHVWEKYYIINKVEGYTNEKTSPSHIGRISVFPSNQGVPNDTYQWRRTTSGTYNYVVPETITIKEALEKGYPSIYVVYSSKIGESKPSSSRYIYKLYNLPDKSPELGSSEKITVNFELVRYREAILEEVKGSYIEDVYSTNSNSYPKNGKEGSYWYVYKGVSNSKPELLDNTQIYSNKTLYENNVLTLNGSAVDEDEGDVVTVKYQVNSGTIRTISAGISSTSYNKTLKFKQGYLYDDSTKISSKLADNTKHTIKIWAEDDNDNKSDVKIIGFYVVNNRPANIHIDPIVEQTDLVETDYVKITGKVEDPEKDETTLYYKINSKPLFEINTGSNRTFEVRVPVKDLIQGENQLIVRVEDSYGAITERTVILNKQGNSIPLKEGFIEYKLLPPEGETDGLLLWIEREVGDLETEVHVKFGNKEYKKINKKYVGVIEAGVLEEDEYIIENDTKVKDIFLRITMKRNSTKSKQGIRKISGVFN